jgi:serine/threonine-protein kinase
MLFFENNIAEAGDFPPLSVKSQADAEKALADVGLVGVASNPEVSEEAVPGCVFKQSVAAGSKAQEDTMVAFTTALAVGKSTVPDVTGKGKDEAKQALSDAGLGFDYTLAYDDNVAVDKVINQSIPANTSVKSGTTVSVTVSLGTKPAGDVKVPNVMTFSWADAEAALKSAGLVARYTGDPAGIVMFQDVAADTSVAPGTVVTVALAAPQEPVEVPDVKGMTFNAASIALSNVGLAIDSSEVNGTVVDQWPAAGALAAPHSVLHVTLG